VVPHRLALDVELLRDLGRRPPVLQEPEHLLLPRREMRERRRGGHVGTLDDLPEDPDHVMAAHEAHRADLHADSITGGVDEDGVDVRHPHLPREVALEDLARAAALLARNHRRELAAAHVADDPLGGRVDPPDDARGVDHVARDADVLEGGLDVPPDVAKVGHLTECACRRAPESTLARLVDREAERSDEVGAQPLEHDDGRRMLAFGLVLQPRDRGLHLVEHREQPQPQELLVRQRPAPRPAVQVPHDVHLTAAGTGSTASST
jgi:hypothetical protein